MKTRLCHLIAHFQVALVVYCVVLVGGCVATPSAKEAFTPVILEAPRAADPVKIDGLLDDHVWRTAPVYQLSLSEGGPPVNEGGEVQLAWDERFFYIAVRFHDSDIVAEGEQDQLQHFQMGDVVELFLKPDNRTWYWELYATPSGKKSSFWSPGRGRLGLPSGRRYQCGLHVAASHKGTLNDWRDKDHCWTAEMAMPVKDLTAPGDIFAPGSQWRILFGRYNYSRYLSRKELSMCPRLSRTDFHLHEEYGVLQLAR